MKAVLDTNIWISGLLLPNSKAGKILTLWEEAKIELVTSRPILAEIKKVLCYPKIKKRIQWDEKKIDQYILLINFFTIVVSTDGINIAVERDPNDSPILETLLASDADYLVTGDQDLLVLQHQHRIITLDNFYQLTA